MGLLRALFGPRHRTLTVTVYGDDASFERRRALRDAVVSALAATGVGDYLGGGTMATKDEPHYEIAFSVANVRRALPVIREAFRALEASPATEWRVGSAAPRRLFLD